MSFFGKLFNTEKEENNALTKEQMPLSINFEYCGLKEKR